MPSNFSSFYRRVPDNVTEELVAALSGSKSYEFKALFSVIHAALRARNAAGGGEEMLRLRTYDKLQNLDRQKIQGRGQGPAPSERDSERLSEERSLLFPQARARSQTPLRARADQNLANLPGHSPEDHRGALSDDAGLPAIEHCQRRVGRPADSSGRRQRNPPFASQTPESYKGRLAGSCRHPGSMSISGMDAPTTEAGRTDSAFPATQLRDAVWRASH